MELSWDRIEEWEDRMKGRGASDGDVHEAGGGGAEAVSVRHSARYR